MQVTRSGLSLHLSKHAGDASPGGNMGVYMPSGVEAFHAELLARNHRSMRPGLTQEDWGLEMVVVDPFNNRIRFMERNSG